MDCDTFQNKIEELCYENNLEEAQKLSTKYSKYKISISNILWNGCRQNSLDIIKWLLPSTKQWHNNVFIWACLFDSLAIVKYIVECDIFDSNNSLYDGLHEAYSYKNFKTLDWLINSTCINYNKLSYSLKDYLKKRNIRINNL